MPKTIFISAVEKSSQMLALDLLRVWKSEKKSFKAVGWGSEEMQKEGFKCLDHINNSNVLLLQSALKGILFWRLHSSKTKKFLLNNPCDLVVVMDSGFLHFPLLKWFRKKISSTPVVYYPPPQLAFFKNPDPSKLLSLTNLILYLFHFEHKIYKNFPKKAKFVTHPIVKKCRQKVTLQQVQDYKKSKKLDPMRPLVSLFPGSRTLEVKENFWVQVRVAKKTLKTNPELQFVVRSVEGIPFKFYENVLEKEKMRDVIHVEKHICSSDLLKMSDRAMVVSGTIALEAALCAVPFVGSYFFNSNFIIFLNKKIIKSRGRVFKYALLPNIILDRLVIPEFVNQRASQENFDSYVKAVEKTFFHSGTKERFIQIQSDLFDKMEQKSEDILPAHKIWALL